MKSAKSINALLLALCLTMFSFVLVSSKMIDNYEMKQKELELSAQVEVELPTDR